MRDIDQAMSEHREWERRTFSPEFKDDEPTLDWGNVADDAYDEQRIDECTHSCDTSEKRVE